MDRLSDFAPTRRQTLTLALPDSRRRIKEVSVIIYNPPPLHHRSLPKLQCGGLCFAAPPVGSIAFAVSRGPTGPGPVFGNMWAFCGCFRTAIISGKLARTT